MILIILISNLSVYILQSCHRSRWPSSLVCNSFWTDYSLQIDRCAIFWFNCSLKAFQITIRLSCLSVSLFYVTGLTRLKLYLPHTGVLTLQSIATPRLHTGDLHLFNNVISRTNQLHEWRGQHGELGPTTIKTPFIFWEMHCPSLLPSPSSRRDPARAFWPGQFGEANHTVMVVTSHNSSFTRLQTSLYVLTDSNACSLLLPRVSRDDVVNRTSVLSCETVYVPRGLKGLIHLAVSLSAQRVCTRQRQVVA